MQNSIAWIVSAALSVAAHFGLMTAAGHIELPQSGQEQLAQVVLGGGAFQAVTLDAAEAVSAIAAEATDTLTEPAGPSEAMAAPADAAVSMPQQADEIAQSANAEERQSAAPDSELAPATPGAIAAQPEKVAEIAAAQPSASLAPEAGTSAVQETASAAAGETPSATAAPLAPAPASVVTALPEQAVPEAASVAAPDAAPPSAAVIAEAPPASKAGTVETAPAELASSASVAELAPVSAAAALPQAPAETAQPLEDGTKMAAAVTAAAPAMSQGDRVRSFLRDYQGNGCLYAQAGDTDAARPRFRGLGGQSGAVEDFASAFRQAVGVEPELALRTVMDSQCPVVDFMKAIVGSEPQNLEVVLDQDIVQNGGMLIGRLEGRVQGEILLLLVDDDGAVRDITSEFHRLPNGNFFGIPVALVGEGRGRNQLVLALASVEPLGVSVARKPGEAAALFRDLARRISTDGLPVRTAYAAFQVQ